MAWIKELLHLYSELKNEYFSLRINAANDETLLSAKKSRRTTPSWFVQQQSKSTDRSRLSEAYVPGFSGGLHVIGYDDVVGPDVILPLVKSDHTGQHRPGVYSNAHVDLHAGRITHVSAIITAAERWLTGIDSRPVGWQCWDQWEEFLIN